MIGSHSIFLCRGLIHLILYLGKPVYIIIDLRLRYIYILDVLVCARRVVIIAKHMW